MTLYQLLNIQQTATDAQIKRAYRRLAKKYHPDVNKSEEAAERFRHIYKAYEILIDPITRELYDARLREEADRNTIKDFINRNTFTYQRPRSTQVPRYEGFVFDDREQPESLDDLTEPVARMGCYNMIVLPVVFVLLLYGFIYFTTHWYLAVAGGVLALTALVGGRFVGKHLFAPDRNLDSQHQ